MDMRESWKDNIRYIGFNHSEFEDKIKKASGILGITLNDDVDIYCYASLRDFVKNYIYMNYECEDIEYIIDFIDIDKWFVQHTNEHKDVYMISEDLIIYFDIWPTYNGWDK